MCTKKISGWLVQFVCTISCGQINTWTHANTQPNAWLPGGDNKDSTRDREKQTEAHQSKTDTERLARYKVYSSLTAATTTNFKHKELRNAAALLKLMPKAVSTILWACQAIDYVNMFPKVLEMTAYLKPFAFWIGAEETFIKKKKIKASNTHFTAHSSPAGEVPLMWYFSKWCSISKEYVA